MEKSLSPGAAKTKVLVFCVAALILYAYGVLSARAIPMHIEGVALPLDFMVGIPLGFYLLVVRPRRLTPLTVIPVIWSDMESAPLPSDHQMQAFCPFCSQDLFPWSWPSPRESA